MSTPASLLDLIARGGPVAASADIDRQNAATALTQAQVPQVQAQTAASQAQLPGIQEQAKQAAIDTQLKQRQLHDEQAMSDIMHTEDPKVLLDPRLALGVAAKHRMSAPGAIGFANTISNLQKGFQGLDAGQLDNESKNLQQIQGGLQGYESAKTPEAYASFYQQINAAEPAMVQQLQLPAPGQGLPTDQQIADLEGRTKLFGVHIEQAQKKAEADKLNADTGLANFNLNLRKEATPANLQAQVAGIIDPQKYPTQYQQAINLGTTALKYGGPDAALAAVKDVYAQIAGAQKEDLERLGKVQTATDLQNAELPGEVKKATAVANATAPIQVATEVAKQKAISAMSPSAFSNITNVGEQRAAMNEADQVQKDYTTKSEQVDQFRDILDQVKAGNKAAPALASIQELRGMVNRVNRSELAAVSTSAGSALDKVEGWLGGKVEGQPIPADVLAGMTKIADVQQAAADRVWQHGLERLKTRGVNTDALAKPSSGKAATTPTITSQAQFDALAKGATFIEDGKTYRKP